MKITNNAICHPEVGDPDTVNTAVREEPVSTCTRKRFSTGLSRLNSCCSTVYVHTNKRRLRGCTNCKRRVVSIKHISITTRVGGKCALHHFLTIYCSSTGPGTHPMSGNVLDRATKFARSGVCLDLHIFIRRGNRNLTTPDSPLI